MKDKDQPPVLSKEEILENNSDVKVIEILSLPKFEDLPSSTDMQLSRDMANAGLISINQAISAMQSYADQGLKAARGEIGRLRMDIRALEKTILEIRGF